MADKFLCNKLPNHPPDLVQAAADEAERDADRVGLLLTTLGLKPSIRLPVDFLLALGAALRLCHWEQNRIDLHLRAGLPPARQAVDEVFRTAAGNAAPGAAERSRNLADRVAALFVERFAWSGRAELGADLTLEPADEDALLDGLADFLWANRPAYERP